MKTKYIHIGMPKNLSTSLQRDFFSKHPQIHHLGVGVGSNVDYINPKIASACENHFQYSKNFTYQKAKLGISRAFNSEFEKFETNQTKRVCGISLELLSFTFTTDQIEIEEKAKRVFNAFGLGTKIVLIIRNQRSLIESLYKEAIKIGYYGTFNDFLDFIYYSRDRNFIFDFQYDYLYNIYSNLFGAENIEIICIENYRDESGKLRYENNTCLLTNKLSQVLGLDDYELDLDHYNKPLSLTELYNMRELNKTHVHGLGNQSFSTGTNFHRLKDYFCDELNISIEESLLYKDARIKNENITKAKQLKNNEQEIRFSYPNEILTFLKNMFIESNERLARKTGISLPYTYYQY